MGQSQKPTHSLGGRRRPTTKPSGLKIAGPIHRILTNCRSGPGRARSAHPAEFVLGSPDIVVYAQNPVDSGNLQNLDHRSRWACQVHSAASVLQSMIDLEQCADACTGNEGEFRAVDDQIPDSGFNQALQFLTELSCVTRIKASVSHQDHDLVIDFIEEGFHRLGSLLSVLDDP